MVQKVPSVDIAGEVSGSLPALSYLGYDAVAVF